MSPRQVKVVHTIFTLRVCIPVFAEVFPCTHTLVLLWNKWINQCFVLLEPQLRQSAVISKSSTQQPLGQTAGRPPTTGDQR